MAEVATSPHITTNGESDQSAIKTGIEAHAGLPTDVSAIIAALGRRIEELEQKFRGRAEPEPGTETNVGADEREREPEAKPTEVAKPDGEQDGPEPKSSEVTEADLLRTYVEFRKEAYVEGKMEWLEDKETEGLPSPKKTPFRYDSHDNGKLTFSVYRSAALYETLLEFCPPAHDSEVTVVDDRLEITGAFPLLHCRDKLKMLEDSTPDDAIGKELKVMRQLYERKGHLLHAQRRYDELLVGKKIDCESLKGLFFKDQLVVFRELRDEWAVARVKMVTTNSDDGFSFSLDRNVALELECEAIDFDGKSFRNHLYRKEIDIFSGTRSITELSVYPLSYHRGKDDLIRDSIVSGQIWKDLHDRLTKDGQVVSQVMQYSGYCETFDDDYAEDKTGIGSEIAGRVIVDPSRFADRRLTFVQHNVDPFAPTPFGDNPENNPLVLCPEKVLVHSLSDNEWYYVAMSKLRFPAWVPDAWSRLVKPDSKPIADSIERIRALAKAHAEVNRRRETHESLDNFRGKGKGLTFLLHGPPGVGKTMLAECLSEENQRPLYRVNLGMLVTEDRWESKIEEIFRQAHFWNAILLIDEAEVILAERTQESMHSLAWVAAFLRKIEYFEGILFLTTNQIHMIDPAFISRVNLGIKFPELDSETRLQIWNKILGGLDASNKADWLIGDVQTLKKWATQPLNGRQIRNVVYSARLLADPPIFGKLTREGIEECLQDVIKFMDMIKEEKKMVEMNYMSHWS